MEIRDLAGVSEPLKKLFDVVSAGVGGIFKPYLDKKDAEAIAYEAAQMAKVIAEHQGVVDIEYDKGPLKIKLKDRTRSNVSDIRVVEPASLDLRTLKRISYQEFKRQNNIENIVEFAANELEDKTVSSDKVEDDWINRFFSISQNISNEGMQILWGKILAGEIKKPSSYSLRTLDVLSNMSQNEAEIFSRVAQYMIETAKTGFIFYNLQLLEHREITIEKLLTLWDAGLIADPAAILNYELPSVDDDHEISLINGDNCIIIYRKKGTPNQEYPVISLTKAGLELSTLVDKQPDLAYYKVIQLAFENENVNVNYAEITSRIGENISIGRLMEIPEGPFT